MDIIKALDFRMLDKGLAMKKIIIIGAVITATAIGGFYSMGSFAKEEQKPVTAPAQEVTVLNVTVQKISTQQSLPGRVTAFRQSEVRPQVDGIITERLFEEGSNVEKGQQLYQIDASRYTALLNSANADLQSAKANVQSIEARAGRYKDLVKVGAVSKQENDDAVAQMNTAKAAVAVAQAAVDLAKVNLDYTKVYSPISGQIGRSFVTDGTLVTANQSQALTMITQLDPVYVDMQQSLSESDVADIRSHMSGKNEIPVRLMMGRQGKAYQHQGTLKFSEVTVDQTSSSIALRALFPNPEGTLLPGSFVRAVIELGETDAVLVPQRATTRTPEGQLRVWIVDEQGKAQQRAITVGQAYEDQWIVETGLAQGDRVIVEGYQKVRPDAVVKIATAEEKQAQSPEAKEQ